MKAQILNLYSNEKEMDSGLKNDHGQSFLISIGEEKILFDFGQKGPMNFPRNSGHRVKPQAEKFRIPAALHNQARSDVFFCCRRFQYSKTGC
jgi:hypothetical protein